MKSRCPLHAVAIVGRPIAIASMYGRPHPSPREASTNASAARSQPYYLDVTHPQANKGEVVLVMSSLLKIPLEAIATIGDMPNDVLMFKKSGISIAMGNASDEVQKSATYVTTSSENEGFANAMEKFVLQSNAAAR